MAEPRDIAVIHFTGAADHTVVVSPEDGEQVAALISDGGPHVVEVKRDSSGERVVVRLASVAYVAFRTLKPPARASSYVGGPDSSL